MFTNFGTEFKWLLDWISMFSTLYLHYLLYICCFPFANLLMRPRIEGRNTCPGCNLSLIHYCRVCYCHIYSKVSTSYWIPGQLCRIIVGYPGYVLAGRSLLMWWLVLHCIWRMQLYPSPPVQVYGGAPTSYDHHWVPVLQLFGLLVDIPNKFGKSVPINIQRIL